MINISYSFKSVTIQIDFILVGKLFKTKSNFRYKHTFYSLICWLYEVVIWNDESLADKNVLFKILKMSLPKVWLIESYSNLIYCNKTHRCEMHHMFLSQFNFIVLNSSSNQLSNIRSLFITLQICIKWCRTIINKKWNCIPLKWLTIPKTTAVFFLC